ncbi:hypothetical protein AgCh_020479 [Apium graveolens]
MTATSCKLFNHGQQQFHISRSSHLNPITSSNQDMDQANPSAKTSIPRVYTLAGTSFIRPERTSRALYGSVASYPPENNRSELSKERVDQKIFVTVVSRVVVVKSSIRLNEKETPEFGVAVGSDPSNIVGGLGMEPYPVGALGAGGVGVTGEGLTGGLML